MIQYPFILLVFSLLTVKSFSQNDSVLHSPNVRLEDGIYLSYKDFRMNNGIKKEQVISDMDKEQLEFLSKIISSKKFSFKENGTVKNAESEYVWGYMQNNTLYVNHQGSFYRVPVFGAISYFVASITVNIPISNGYGMYNGSTTKTIITEFVLDFYSGSITENPAKSVGELIAGDKTLSAEYKKIGKRRQKEQVYSFIRRYNSTHPIYFLR